MGGERVKRGGVRRWVWGWEGGRVKGWISVQCK